MRKNIHSSYPGHGQSNAEVFEALWCFRQAAYVLARRIVRNQALAEDVVQEAFLQAWKAIQIKGPPDELRTWLLRITANCAKSNLRRRVRRQRREEAVMVAGKRYDEGSEDKEQTLALAASLEELEEKLRIPLCLCFEVGLSQKEVCEILGCSPSAVSKYIRLGLEKLRHICMTKGLAVQAVALPTLLGDGLGLQTQVFPKSLEVALKAAQENIFMDRSPAADLSSQRIKRVSPFGFNAKILLLTTMFCVAAACGWHYSNQPETSMQMPTQPLVEPGQAQLNDSRVRQTEYYWDFNAGIPNEFKSFQPSSELVEALQKTFPNLDKRVSWADVDGIQGSGGVRFGARGGHLIIPISIPFKLAEATLECDFMHTHASDSWMDTFIFWDSKGSTAFNSNDPGNTPGNKKLDANSQTDIMETIEKKKAQAQGKGSLLHGVYARSFKGNQNIKGIPKKKSWRHLIRRMEHRSELVRSFQYVDYIPGGRWEWRPVDRSHPGQAQAYAIVIGKNVVLDNLRLALGEVGLLPARKQPPSLACSKKGGLAEKLQLEGDVKKVDVHTRGEIDLSFGEEGGVVYLPLNLEWDHIYVECLVHPRPKVQLVNLKLVVADLEIKESSFSRNRTHLKTAFAISRKWIPWSFYVRNGIVMSVKLGNRPRNKINASIPEFTAAFRIKLQGKNVVIRDLNIRFENSERSFRGGRTRD